jgi:ribulose-phosphate 3-epimerase
MATGNAFDMLRKLCPTVSVGVLTADLMNLGAECRTIEQEGVRLLHIDVMDGCFCPMMTVGPPFIKAVKTGMLKDVHLMIDDPVTKVADFVAAGADMITVHVESTRHIHRVLQQLSSMKNSNDPERGVVRGVALNPGTPLTALSPLLDQVDMVLLLAVNPGWSGQKLGSGTDRRVAELRLMLREEGRPEVLVAVDGGVTRENAQAVRDMGADIIVTGSAVFDGKAAAENARFMLETVGRQQRREAEAREP